MKKTGRRAFLGTLAVAPLVPSALGPPAAPVAATDAAPPAGREAVADALAEALKREFGAQLDESELPEVKKKLLRNLERAERLRKAAWLANADEPVGRFEAAAPATKGGRR
jgi:hypothetical protein